MDRPDNSEADLRRALADLGRVNRWLGGRSALVRALAPLFLRSSPGRTIDLLDIGTGGGDMPLSMVRLAERLGRRISVTAIDRDPHTIAIATAETADCDRIRVLRADAFELPFAPRSFDLVTVSLLLHHLTHVQAVRLLRSLRSIARQAVVVNDLQRNWIPWAFFHVFSRLTRLHPMVVHDGPLSILRGFTRGELRRIAREAGSSQAELRGNWSYRLTLIVPCTEPG